MCVEVVVVGGFLFHWKVVRLLGLEVGHKLVLVGVGWFVVEVGWFVVEVCNY